VENCFHLDNLVWSIFNEINDAVLVFDTANNHLLKYNNRVSEVFGTPDQGDMRSHIRECLSTGGNYTISRMEEYARMAISGRPQVFEWRAQGRDGQQFWVEISLRPIALSEELKVVVMVIRNITPLKNASEELLNSENRFREFAESLPEVVYEINSDEKVTFCNNAAFDVFGLSREEFEKGISIMDLLSPEDRQRCRENMARVMQGEIAPSGNEYTMVKKDGTPFPVILHSRPIIKGSRAVGIRGFFIDITELKENEEKLRYLSYHDALTGLYNRHYFEQQLGQLNKNCCRAGILVCDVDGLKIINDTFGHIAGDRRLIAAANIISHSFGKQGVAARIGGDEFAVLLPNGDLDSAQEGIDRIKEAVDSYNRQLTGIKVPLSLSCGTAFWSGTPVAPWKLFEEADNNMYRQKLYRHQSTRSATVQVLLKALEARDFITEGHADRLKDFVSSLGRSLMLPEHKVTDLCLLAHFHDIGKVGIPDRILFKKDNLTSKEFAEMQRHSEIGFKIAQSSHDLMPIADLILKHHEWWNGQGYPLGLKGEDIPLECRILAIADAYDAMTNDRPYRKAMAPEAAIAELKNGAGSQFDPELVELFVALLPELIEDGTDDTDLCL